MLGVIFLRRQPIVQFVMIRAVHIDRAAEAALELVTQPFAGASNEWEAAGGPGAL
jgi:hypothetical protein